jgi:chromosome segregation ATPase
MKIQHQAELTILKQELLKEKDKSRELNSKNEQIEMKAQHSETKIKNLEKSLSQLPKKTRPDNLDAEYKKIAKELSLATIKLQRSEDQYIDVKRELENMKKLIEDRDGLIKEMRFQLQEAGGVYDEKVRKKESEIQVLQRDMDFTAKKHEDQIRKHQREVKGKDIEIERLQDKVQMLEIKLENTDDGIASQESFDEKRQSKFNYEAHWVIEENLRERISELKKELTNWKATIEEINAQKDSFEDQLIKVKTQWANSELERALMHMSPDKNSNSD